MEQIQKFYKIWNKYMETVIDDSCCCKQACVHAKLHRKTFININLKKGIDLYYHLSNPLIAPMSMNYQKSLQKAELGYREVTCHHGL